MDGVDLVGIGGDWGGYEAMRMVLVLEEMSMSIYAWWIASWCRLKYQTR